MADYLSTNTARLRVTQTGPRGTHKMVFRAAPESSKALVIGSARTIVTAMQGFLLSTTAFSSAEWAEYGSDVFLPADWGAPIVTTAPNAASNTTPYGIYLNFPGRSAAGSRVAFYLFNIFEAFQTTNNRLTPAEQPAVTGVCDALDGASGILCGIDQTSFIMKRYANSGINDRVAKKSRSLV